MSIVILKFGGRLLETPENINLAARHVIQTKDCGDDPVVVVSALGEVTDRYTRMAYEVAEHPDERELDMLLSVGERIAMSLLAMAINADAKYHAVSFTGSQVGIITDTRHTDARILEVKGYRIREALEEGHIPIVAGFQGISVEREITTLGRGGSDATAVALAVALNAERCELVKESGGIFSADPIIVEDAVKFDRIDYDTLVAIASAGAKVVQPHAAALARQHRVKLSITGSGTKKGTLVSDRVLAPCAISAIVIDEGLNIERHRDFLSMNLKSNWQVIASTETENLIVNSSSSSINQDKAAQITIIGWGGVLGAEVIDTVKEIIEVLFLKPRFILGLQGKLAVIVDKDLGRPFLSKIHSACLEKGYIVNQ